MRMRCSCISWLVVLIITSIMITSCSRSPEKESKPVANSGYKNLKAPEVMRMIDEKAPLILDVRTPQEYKSGHLAGAKLLPLQELPERISEIEEYKDKPIVIYCHSGNRSSRAARTLEKNGFTKIYNFQGGILSWESKGYKIEKER